MLFYLLLLYMLCSMIARADANEEYADFARPGGWNGIFLLCCLINEAFSFTTLLKLLNFFLLFK